MADISKDGLLFIIIIMWLVLWWTLPFLRACSMLADSELGDRQLPDQCSGAPGQIQWSVTKCDVVGPSDGASTLAEGSRWPEGHGCGPWKHQREQCGQRTSDERYE